MVSQKHAAIAHLAFGKDLGIKLMAIEGKIARRVAVHFCSTGRPCLPTHDSFQVARSDAYELIDVMRAEYFKIFYRYPKLKYDGCQIADLQKISISTHSNQSYSPPYLRMYEVTKTVKPAYNHQKRG